VRAAVTHPSLRGFSLIELVITIVVLGIIAVVAGAFLLPAFNAYQGLERRAALVEAAESAIRRMSRDIRISLPNSVRTIDLGGPLTGFAIEMVPTVDGARHCTAGTADCDTLPLGGAVLTIGSSGSAFDVLGCFSPNTSFRPAALFPATTTAYRLAVGNPTAAAAVGPNDAVYTATGNSAVITPYSVVNTIQLTIVPDVGAGCGTQYLATTSYRRHRVTLSAAHTFSIASPRQRVFVILDSEAPVTYICNVSAGTLRRYVGYKTATSAYSDAVQPVNPLVLPLSSAIGGGRLVADNVTACTADSTEANVQRSGVVTLSLTLSSSGETVQLINQVQLDNSQ
jgi:MSHA biogenesis protein MshO